MRFAMYSNDALFNAIPDLESKILLDIGTGSESSYSHGFMESLYNKLVTKHGEDFADEQIDGFYSHVVAVDIEVYKGYLSFLEDRLVCADGRNLPFKNESFDIVAIGWLLDLLANFKPTEDNSEIIKLMEELSRVTKPSGYVIGDVPLHPLQWDGMFGIPMMILNIPEYYSQIASYRKIFEKF